MCACARVRLWVRERDEGDGMMGSAKDNLVLGGGGFSELSGYLHYKWDYIAGLHTCARAIMFWRLDCEFENARWWRDKRCRRPGRGQAEMGRRVGNPFSRHAIRSKQHCDSGCARSEKKRDRVGHHSAEGPGFGIHERHVWKKKKKKDKMEEVGHDLIS